MDWFYPARARIEWRPSFEPSRALSFAAALALAAIIVKIVMAVGGGFALRIVPCLVISMAAAWVAALFTIPIEVAVFPRVRLEQAASIL
jgi:hypothetical protein